MLSDCRTPMLLESVGVLRYDALFWISFPLTRIIDRIHNSRISSLRKPLS